MMDNIKCIIADCDGTILRSDKTLDTDLLQTLHLLQKKGIFFTIASGRNIHLLQQYVNTLNIKGPYITDNGASIYDNDKCIYQKLIDNLNINLIKDICIYNRLPCIFYGQNMIASYHGKPDLSYFKTKVHASFQLINLSETDANLKNIYKVVVNAKDCVNIDKIQQQINQLSNKIIFCKSEDSLFTCTNISASKGQALIKLLDILHISRDNVMVFGDNYNDISMFKIAKIAVAMNNASDDIKKYASSICLNNDNNGVSIYLKNLLLNKTL